MASVLIGIRGDYEFIRLIPGEYFSSIFETVAQSEQQFSFGADSADQASFDPVNRNRGHPRRFGQLVFADQAAFSYFFNEIVNHVILRLIFTCSYL
jgi:hypothetical protein